MERKGFRRLPRIGMNMPLRVDIQPQGKSGGRTKMCTSDNISAGGVRLFSRDRIEVGATVSMVLVMPREVSHWLPLPYEFTGKVIRVDSVGSGSEVKFGIAVEFVALRNVLPPMYLSGVGGAKAR